MPNVTTSSSISTITVRINEVVSRVVRRVNINELHPPKVGFVEQLQDFEVFAFDEKILRRVEVDRLAFGRNERAPSRLLQFKDRLPLARPGERVAFGPLVHGTAERGAELVEIHFSFGESFGHRLAERGQAFRSEVRAGRRDGLPLVSQGLFPQIGRRFFLSPGSQPIFFHANDAEFIGPVTFKQ